jgi:leucine dehydrogenase
LEHLHKEGAKLFITDINESMLAHYSKEFGATVVKGNEIYGLDVDVFAPCALGAILNTENINQLKCAIVSGAANNQLADENVHGPMLVQKGIAYAPDFLINAGGLINVYQEHIGYNRETAFSKTQHIYDVTLEIYKNAAATNTHTQQAAMNLAEKRINDMQRVHSTY